MTNVARVDVYLSYAHVCVEFEFFFLLNLSTMCIMCFGLEAVDALSELITGFVLVLQVCLVMQQVFDASSLDSVEPSFMATVLSHLGSFFLFITL